MDNLNQKIKHLVQKGKEKGYLTYEELNDMLPDDADISPEKIDDILMMLDELGIDLIDETEIESRDVADAEEAPVFHVFLTTSFRPGTWGKSISPR
jgi:RNA polymerase primary sigma factor